jgi:hypothetical protein
MVSQSRLADAEPLLLRAVEILKNDPQKRRGTLLRIVLWNLHALYRAERRTEEAESYARQVDELDRRLFGSDAPPRRVAPILPGRARDI